MTTTINAGTGLVATADASSTLAFQTGGTTAMTIDSSQRVGIGNTSPTTTLGVTGTAYISGNITAGGGSFGSGNISTTGNIQGGNFIGIIAATSSSITGNLTAGNMNIIGTAAAGGGVLVVSGNIQTSTSNATANIGNASNYFNRLFAQSTTALYADLAEMYTTDAEYAPGTVLIFGGNQEVTISTVTHDTRVAGVVSTNPAHIMNSGLQAERTVEVALVGRVPMSVIGNITAGDRVVTSNQAGVAEALDITRYQPGVIIGKALTGYSGNGIGVIEVVVGRL